MQTSYIRTVLKVAQAGSMAKAAPELYLLHPTVANQVNHLEKELGFKIFDRTRSKTRPLIITERGAKWLAHARKALELLDAGAVPMEIKRIDRVRRQRKAS